jgi:hypothetical protein
MKKKIFFFLFLIAVATGGSVFAKPGDDVSFVLTDTDVSKNAFLKITTTGAQSIPDSKAKITINSVKQSLVGIDVNYSCDNAPGNVQFYFTAYFTEGRKPVTWYNKEKITSPRKSSTFRFPLRNWLYIESLSIEYTIFK